MVLLASVSRGIEKHRGILPESLREDQVCVVGDSALMGDQGEKMEKTNTVEPTVRVGHSRPPLGSLDLTVFSVREPTGAPV